MSNRDKAEVNSKIARVRNNGRWHGRGSDWSTPQELFNELDAEFHFTLDPCASDWNAKCKKYYTEADNGLVQEWTGETVFMNPPYGKDLKLWMQKAYESNATVVCLVPAATDTSWWHDFVMKADAIRFIKGRLKFDEHKNSAPFPSAIIIFSPKDTK